MRLPPVVVTRHAALVALLQERGIIKDDSVSVIAHATPADITGRDVIVFFLGACGLGALSHRNPIEPIS